MMNTLTLTLLRPRLANPLSTLLLISLTLLSLTPPPAQADYGYNFGAVMARGLVKDENNQPILVKYQANGEEAGTVDLPDDADINTVSILSANAYNSQQQRLSDYQQQYADDLASDAQLMSRRQFLAGNYPLADDSASITPQLGNQYHSVLVRGQSYRYTNDAQQLPLLSFTVDLSQNLTLADDTVSVVLNKDGQVIAQASERIAWRADFFGDADGTPSEQFSRDRDDTIYGPITNAKVYMDEFVYPGAVDVTDAEGKYHLRYNKPYVPGFAMSITTDAWVKLQYKNFSPIGAPSLPYYLRRQSWDVAYSPPAVTGTTLAEQAAQINAIGVYASLATPAKRPLDFKVDVMFLSGAVTLQNPDGSAIPVADSTQYHAFDQDADDITQTQYDFNGDGTPDHVVKGKMLPQNDDQGQPILDHNNNPVLHFVPESQLSGDTPDTQGVYFNQADASADDSGDFNPPDLTRLMDTQIRHNQPAGYLKHISVDDLKHTDILVFRESTGQLVVERIGLRDEEVNGRKGTGYNNEREDLFYRIMLRGPKDYDINIGNGSRQGGHEAWYARNQYSEPFQKRNADHLKPGEVVKIIAINRATGYIGTQRVTLKSASDNADSSLTVPIDTITMRPPNLKIWAQRDYTVEQGMTKDEERSYTIGAEGAALTSDSTVTIYSEWLDHDGSPLPEGLGVDNGEQYGLTGRLAKIVAQDQIAGVSNSDLALFPIAPGRRTQVVTVSSNLSTPEHYYIHIHGAPKDCNGDNYCPEFGTNAAATPPYDTRPEHIVPFLVPLYDEETHWSENSAWRQAKQNQADDDDTELNKPLPAYAWQFRPEYQFSQYELTMNEINKIQNPGEPEEVTENLIELDEPVLSNGADLIEVLYSLISSDFERLTPIDGKQELVLALGEEEARVTLGEDKTISFTNLDHIASLDPEDFVTMRLYTNNDAGNILWEWAFEYLDYYAVIDDDILPSEVDGAIEISADDTKVDLVAHLIGFANRSPENKYDVLMNWKKEGTGTLDRVTDHDDDYAIFKNTLTLPTSAGASSKVTAELSLSSGGRTGLPLSFRVVPGQTHSVTAAPRQGSTPIYIGGEGKITIDGVATDQFGNRVADGTAVTVTTDGAIKLEVQPESTVDGEFSFTVSGTDYSEATQVAVRVGDFSQSVDINVNPVNIVFNGLPSQVDVNERVSFSIDVTAGGAPVSDYEFDVWAENGRLTESTITTDDNGHAQLFLIAPPNESTITVKAMTAMQSPAIAQLTAQSSGSSSLNNHRTKMVGDAVVETAFNYTRWDNNSFSVNKAIASSIEVMGDEGDNVIVNIGDIFAPNRLTQAAYWMNDAVEAKDEVGFSNGVLENVTLSRDTRLFAGNSYRFDQATPSYIKVADATRLKLSDDNAFVVDIKPTASSGQIFNLGNGLSLDLLAGNTLRLTANTDAGIYTATQVVPLALNQWHQVAGSFTNGVLTLAVGQERIQEAVTGSLTYSAINSQDLVIGEGYDGLMNSLKWFNLASGPITTFANNTETTTITIDATGKATVPVNSKGNMLSFGSKLPMQSIAISAGDTRQTIELLSTETFETVAAASLSGGLVSGTPDFDLSAIGHMPSSSIAQTSPYSLLQSDALFPKAHAYDIDFSDIMSIAGSLIGLDSLEVIWNQFGNLIAGKEFDVVAFSVAILDVLSLFPPAAPLRAVTTPAKLAIKLLKVGNTKAVQYLGGVLKKMFQQAKGRDFTLVYQGIAFFIIMADMALDEEAREGIAEIAKMINSTDDFLDILDYFSLADDEIELPDTSNASIDDQEIFQQFVGAELGLFPQAHASVTGDTGKLLGKALAELAPVLSRAGKGAPKTLGEVGRILSSTSSGGIVALRKQAFKKEFIQSVLDVVKRGGLQKLRNFLLGYNGQRISPMAMIAITAYLETEVESGALFEKSSPLRERNIDQLRQLYFKAMPATINGNSIGNAQGASYHLMMLASLHASSQATLSGTGYEVGKVVGIEIPRNIPIYEKTTDASRLHDDINSYKTFQRKIDIMTGTIYTSEKWWEAKSWRSVSSTNLKPKNKMSAFNWDKGGKLTINEEDGHPHKQFVLDRVAMNRKVLASNVEMNAAGMQLTTKPWINVSDFYWLFHKFVAGNNRDIVNPKLSFIKDTKEGLLQVPKTVDKQLYTAHVGVSDPSSRINLGAIQILLDILKENGSEIAIEAINELNGDE